MPSSDNLLRVGVRPLWRYSLRNPSKDTSTTDRLGLFLRRISNTIMIMKLNVILNHKNI
jgi:hypothetical protein